jgi:phytoene dehydrogenase-like protein
MQNKIIIIGAGIAGLSAGIFGQMNGFDTEIFEMHDQPGGLCTAWKRHGYTFDGCIHWLVGSNPQSGLHQFWNQVGAFENKKIINREYFRQFEGAEGKKLILYSDVEQLERHLLSLSPRDAAPIRQLTDAIREFSGGEVISENSSAQKLIKMGMRQFALEFKDSFLQEAIATLEPTQFILSTLAYYNNQDAGWPEGGSLEFARGIEKKYLSLGGKIHYRARVKDIIVENGQATGIRLADGATHPADLVISSADGFETLHQILDGKYIDERLEAIYTRSTPYPSSVQISLGVDCDLSDQPHSLLIKLHSPIVVGEYKRPYLSVNHYSYDKSMCPPGKSVLTTLIHSDYAYWEKLHQDPAAYQAEKERLANEVIRTVESRFPEVKGKIEVVDVATPLTYHRYTGAWEGCYMSWMIMPDELRNNIPVTLPGLNNFYMTGQWTWSGGGLPVALMSARGCLMNICKQRGKKFVG